MFAQRLIQPELLDHALPDVARKNLADLVKINRRFGGHSTIRRLLASAVAPEEAFTLLDVGAASGDTGKLVGQLYQRAKITNLDCNKVNLQSASYPKVIADAFHIPFRAESFDVVFSSLFLHHFENSQVEALLTEMYRVARRAILITDLERHILPYLFLPLSKRLFSWNDITVHDGIRSVRAAFRPEELTTLAKSAGIRNPRVESHRPAFRLTLSARKQSPA